MNTSQEIKLVKYAHHLQTTAAALHQTEKTITHDTADSAVLRK